MGVNLLLIRISERKFFFSFLSSQFHVAGVYIIVWILKTQLTWILIYYYSEFWKGSFFSLFCQANSFFIAGVLIIVTFLKPQLTWMLSYYHSEFRKRSFFSIFVKPIPCCWSINNGNVSDVNFSQKLEEFSKFEC